MTNSSNGSADVEQRVLVSGVDVGDFLSVINSGNPTFSPREGVIYTFRYIFYVGKGGDLSFKHVSDTLPGHAAFLRSLYSNLEDKHIIIEYISEYDSRFIGVCSHTNKDTKLKEV